MPKSKAIALTVIIDGLLAFVYLWARDYTTTLFTIYRTAMVLLGAVSLVNLTYRFVLEPAPANRERGKHDRGCDMIYGEDFTAR